METLLKTGVIGLGILLQLAGCFGIKKDITNLGTEKTIKNFIIVSAIIWISMYFLFHICWTVIPLAITEGIPAVFNLLCKTFDVSPMMFIGGCIGLYVLIEGFNGIKDANKFKDIIGKHIANDN